VHKAVHVFYIDIRNVSPEDVGCHMKAVTDQFKDDGEEDIIRYFIPQRENATSIDIHYPTSKEVLEKLEHLISMHDVFDMLEL